MGVHLGTMGGTGAPVANPMEIIAEDDCGTLDTAATFRTWHNRDLNQRRDYVGGDLVRRLYKNSYCLRIGTSSTGRERAFRVKVNLRSIVRSATRSDRNVHGFVLLGCAFDWPVG